MKLACVVHRFGPAIAGGSESHCRSIAQRLAPTHDVTVVTTCASDHVTWSNRYAPGESWDGRVRVLRFPVARQRHLHRFVDISEVVFSGRASPDEEEQWFRENGPDAPRLLDYLRERGGEYDRVLFWSFRYAQTYFGLPIVADRAVLLPTAEDDPAVRLAVLDRFFALPAAYLFLTPEEQQLIGRRVPAATPREVIGCGLEPASAADLTRIDRLGVSDPFVLYLGRVDPNKGCGALLRYFEQYVARGGAAQLVLAGPVNMPLPDRPWLRRLGFVNEAVRDALLARARVLAMPSPFESLSIALLEAWNRGVPALVNGRCGVLRGQVLRANGGLFYRTGAEFVAALEYLLRDPAAAAQFAAQGRAYVDREYRWPHVMQKIEAVLERAVPVVSGG
jgi:glycosyltransferase involved in cell wall biosynthesis